MDERLVIQITAEIDELKKQVAEAKEEVRKMAEDTKREASDIDETFQKAGEGIKTGMKIAATAVAGITTALLATSEATQEYRQNQAQLNAAFEQAGITTKAATDTYKQLYKVIGDDDQAVESAANIAMLASSEEEAAKWAELASGVLGTFHDTLQPEAFYEAANETLKLGEATGAFTQMLEQTGVMSVDEFNKKLAECQTEAEKQALMLQVSNDALGAAGESYDKATAGLQANREAQAQLTEALAATGEAMEPIMTVLKQFAGEVLTAIQPYIMSFAENYLPVIRDILAEVTDKLAEALEWIKEHQTLMAAIAIAIGVIVTAIGLYNAIAAIKVAMDAAQVTTLGALVAAQAASAAATLLALAPYIAIVAAIAAVIAIIVLCVKHWDEIKDTVKKVASAIKDKVTEMASKVKEKFEDIKKNITDKIEAAKKAVTDKFEAIRSNIQTKIETTKQNVIDKFNQIKQGITDKVQQAKEAVVNKFNEIKEGITEKINSAKETVTTVFTNIKTSITDKITQAKETALDIFDGIKEGIKDKIEDAKDFVGDMVDKIIDFFDFDWELPDIKLPHFSIKGEFSLSPPSVPRLSIDWYAQGGVFDDPTLFGYGGGIGGLGEAGAEAVVPLENNLGWLDKLAAMLNERMDSGSKQNIVLQVDGKTLAQVSVDNINKLTKQTGRLPLMIV